MDVLVCLAEQAGQPATREKLLETVWSGQVAADELLTGAVSDLRQALGDDPGDPTFIATIPKRGYRLVVTVMPPDRARSEIRATPSPKVWAAVAGAVVIGGALFGLSWINTQPAEIRSITVRPFENLSGDPEQAWFPAGMTEMLNTEISKVGALQVRSYALGASFRDTDLPYSEIARIMEVDAIVEGSALLAGDQARITVRLIEAKTGLHLWADSYERNLSEVLTLHSEVARTIAGEIRVAVTPAEARRLTVEREVDPEAMQLFLQGMRNRVGFNTIRMQEAIGYFERAIEIDPGFTEPFINIARMQLLLAFSGAIPSPEAYPRALREVMRALELDDESPDAHQVLGALSFYMGHEWSKAEESFNRALSLNPNHHRAHYGSAWFYAAMRRWDDADARVARAIELEPIRVNGYVTAADVYYFSRRYDQSLLALQQALDVDPRFSFVHSRFGWNYLQLGRFEDAIASIERAISLDPDEPQFKWQLGHAYAVSGREADARKILAGMTERSETEYILPYGFAIVHAGLGDRDEALRWLDKARQDRNPWFPFMNVDPRLDSLRDDPRFQDLARRMGFPD